MRLALLILLFPILAARAATLVAEGDSITWWIAPGFGYPWIAINGQPWQPSFFTNLAQGGSHFSDLTNRASTADSYYTNGHNNVISVLIGANDLGSYTDAQVTNYYNLVKGYLLDRRTKGFLTLICTVTPRTNSGFNTPRNLFNSLVRSDSSWYDGIADFAADPIMGPDWANTNLTYYNIDGVHPTTVGENILGDIYRPVVSNLLNLTFTNYYVSPNGSDSGPGSLAQPFLTLDRARDALRALPRPFLAPTTVWIRGGRYYLQNAFVLDSGDSGSANGPVIYRNYGNEIPILIGGSVVTNFQTVTNAAILSRLTASAQANVLVANLAAQGITNLGTLTNHGNYTWYEQIGQPEQPWHSELLFEDRAMQLARWPNALVTDPRTNWSLIVAPDTTNTFGYTGNNPIAWQEPTNVFVHGFWAYDFGDSWERVVSIDTNAHVVTLTTPNSSGSEQWGATPHTSGQRFYWLNILEELDMAGEYYIDRVNTNLYFWPPSAITNGACIVSITTNIISVSGASYVTFSGITFEGGKHPLLIFNGGQSNLVVGCEFRGGSSDGIEMLQCTNSGVTHSAFYDLGGHGIFIYGTGVRLTLSSGSNFITYNTFSNVSRLCVNGREPIGITDQYYPYTLNCIGVNISHNLLHDTPGNAILMLGNEHLVEYNEIYNVCSENGDSGALYNGGDPTFYGCVIRYNYIHGVTMSGGGAQNFTGVQAIYADGAQNNLTIYGNVLANVDHAVLINGGRDNIIQNNIFVNITNMITSKLVPFAVACNQSALRNGFTNRSSSYWNRLTNLPYQGALWSNRYPTLATITNGPWVDNINICKATNNSLVGNVCWNFYTNAVAPYTGECFRWEDIAGPCAAAANQTNAIVLNNLTNADPLFVNYSQRNYYLLRSSPAWALGFQWIPISRIGLDNGPTVNAGTANIGTMGMSP